jgi:hypothetical protein
MHMRCGMWSCAADKRACHCLVHVADARRLRLGQQDKLTVEAQLWRRYGQQCPFLAVNDVHIGH